MSEPASERTRTGGRAGLVALALVAYVPLLRTQPGMVGADTKQYLYLDPGELLRRAVSIWDPSVGMGTVTHQNIGYLWPQGPWYWAFDRLGTADWVAQRLWLGTILFAAGTGVVFLLRTLGLRGAGALTAGLAYMLSPYLLVYAARITAILLPWAGLPWLVALLVLALRSASPPAGGRGGWRAPAAFALVVTTVGSINATSLLYVGLAALAWVPFALAAREVKPRGAFAALGRIGVLTAVTQVWWLAALALGGRYGAPVLQASETVEAISTSSSASEVARGLGSWFFYGRDALGPWVEASVPYTQDGWLIAVSFAVPVLALAAAATLRWRHRGYLVVLIALGAGLSVAAYPFADPSPLGSVFRSVTASSVIGLALRNAQRAVPLLALGVACLLGAGVSAAGRVVPRGTALAGLVVGVLVVANLPALWQGTLVDRNLRRPEDVPGYWREAAAALDARHPGTRVLELPGSDFASYRWGNTVDPITPGLIDRPWVARESAPVGTLGSIDLVNALDRRIQEGVFEPEALAPVARLMGVGDVVLRSDLQFERYRTPRPRVLWDQLTPAPPGLGDPEGFGAPVPNVPDPGLPLLDETALAVPAGAEHPPPVAVFPVEDASPVVRTKPVGGAVVLDGDGEGVVDAAAAGLLEPGATLHYAASLAEEDVQAAVDDGATLIVTDTNRRRARRFSAIRETTGRTERAGEAALGVDLADARYDLFPGAGDASRTVTEQRGGATVSATAYGNVVTYTPEDRPAMALDGDPATAWRVGALGDPRGERLVVELDEPARVSAVRLVQPLTGPRNRSLTRVRLRFDSGDDVVAQLDDGSRTEGGQVVRFPGRPVRRMEVVLEATTADDPATFEGLSAVGLAEVGIGGVVVEEVVRLPGDLLAASGDAPLALVLTRLRASPAEPVRLDEEARLLRTLELPAGRSFALAGTARASALAPDEVLDDVLGVEGPVATSSGRLPGDVASRASSALDGDTATAWRPGLGPQEGGWLEVALDRAVVVDGLDLEVMADGRHSVPTRLRVEGDLGEVRVVDVPGAADGDAEGATASVPVAFEAMETDRLRVTVEAVREVVTTDYFGGGRTVLPVAVAELGLAGASSVGRRTAPDRCRDDLVEVDGEPLGVRVVGRAADGRVGLALEACAGVVRLGPGDHDVRAAPGAETGIDVDRLVLRSGSVDQAVASAPAPAVFVRSAGRSTLSLDVAAAGEPFWLVLGQSLSEGWEATLDGGRSLGEPVLIDGYANGWRVEPTGRPMRVDLTWAPQSTVRLALGVSALGVLACLLLVAVDDPRRLLHPRNVRSRGENGVGGDEEPVFELPGVRRRPAVPWWRALAVAAGAGLVAAVVVRPVAGPVVALAMVGALRLRWGRLAVAGAAVALLGAAGLYTAAHQVRYGPPPGFSWAATKHRAHLPGWLGLALLVAAVAADRLGQRRRS